MEPHSSEIGWEKLLTVNTLTQDSSNLRYRYDNVTLCALNGRGIPIARDYAEMRHTTLKLMSLAGLIAAYCGVPAMAFQESKVAPAETAAPSAPVAPKLQLPEGKPGIQLSAPEGGKGTEVRIPGLGKLGVLPKLDFGLDILYGATDDRRQLPGSQGNSDEVTVRGSIKHKF